MTNTYTTTSEKDTRQLGIKLGRNLNPGSVVALSGPLGSGKTSFAKGIAEGIGVDDYVTSPTFTLINEYEGRFPLYHIDTYRLENIEEFQEIGGEELLYGDGTAVIEWSEKIAQLLPAKCVRVNITIMDDGSRTIAVEGEDLL